MLVHFNSSRYYLNKYSILSQLVRFRGIISCGLKSFTILVLQCSIPRHLPRLKPPHGGGLPERHPVAGHRPHHLGLAVQRDRQRLGLPVPHRELPIFRHILLLFLHVGDHDDVGHLQHSWQPRPEPGTGGGKVVDVKLGEKAEQNSCIIFYNILIVWQIVYLKIKIILCHLLLFVSQMVARWNYDDVMKNK